VKQRGLTVDFIPHQVAIHGVAPRSRDLPQFYPLPEICFRRQPTLGNALELLPVQSDQRSELGKVDRALGMSAFLKLHQFFRAEPSRRGSAFSRNILRLAGLAND